MPLYPFQVHLLHIQDQYQSHHPNIYPNVLHTIRKVNMLQLQATRTLYPNLLHSSQLDMVMACYSHQTITRVDMVQARRMSCPSLLHTSSQLDMLLARYTSRHSHTSCHNLPHTISQVDMVQVICTGCHSLCNTIRQVGMLQDRSTPCPIILHLLLVTCTARHSLLHTISHLDTGFQVKQGRSPLHVLN